MYCYQCGCQLTEHDYCPHCGADVAVYKKIIHISNYFYNEGLDKAGVRDLSGAIVSLRQSVRFNKDNIEARNLLGLVYYEMGEVVAALSEWVISKNIAPEKNLADDYINMIQRNQTRLETINQTIKKYNQALTYCNQGSLDLAVIQLKKVLSLNPHFIRAHQLLALLYINNAEWGKAQKELFKCRAIDVNNTTTLRYLKEVESQILPEEAAQAGRRTAPDVIKYQSGNETIIQPAGAKNPGIDAPSLPTNLINIGIGLLVGAAIVGFLVLPARVQAVRQASANELKVVSEQSDAKTATIQEREQQIEQMTSQQEELQQQLEQYQSSEGSISASDALFEAASSYLEDPEDIVSISEAFSSIDYTAVENNASDQFKTLYESLYTRIRPQMMAQYYDTGYTAYQDQDYVSAIDNLEKAVQYGDAEEDGSDYANALYYLADSYYLQYREADNSQKSKFVTNITKAQQGYTAVSTEFPDLRIANTADTRLEEIRNLNIDVVPEQADTAQSGEETETGETETGSAGTGTASSGAGSSTETDGNTASDSTAEEAGTGISSGEEQ
ncbi:MAG: hypothetical protein Q4C60_11595 [Eubacteriales bacterium]|nr:hypothetical protein [Eubacteriales bacterium]